MLVQILYVDFTSGDLILTPQNSVCLSSSFREITETK